MKRQNEERFVLLEEEGSVIMGSGRVLLVDRVTGVTYLLVYGAVSPRSSTRTESRSSPRCRRVNKAPVGTVFPIIL